MLVLLLVFVLEFNLRWVNFYIDTLRRTPCHGHRHRLVRCKPTFDYAIYRKADRLLRICPFNTNPHRVRVADFVHRYEIKLRVPRLYRDQQYIPADIFLRVKIAQLDYGHRDIRCLVFNANKESIR